MNRFFTLMRKWLQNLPIKIFFCFLFPALFILLAFFFQSEYSIHYLSKQTEGSYKQALCAISGNVNDQMKEIVETSVLLSNSPDLKQIFYSNEIVEPMNRYQLTNSINTLITFKSTKKWIRSTFIIQKSNGFVISTQGLFFNEDFFNTYYKYREYDKNFWMTTKANGLNYRILNMTRVRDQLNNTEQNVIPIVEYGIGLNRSNNLLVINVDESSLSEMLRNNKVTANSELYIFNTDNRMISSTGSRTVSSLNDFPPEMRRLQSGSSTLDVTIRGQRYLAVSWVPKLDFLDNYKFLALVPYNDIKVSTFPLQMFSQILMVLALVVGVVCSYFFSKKLYSPIRQLTQLFNSDKSSPDSCDEFEFLNTQIRDTIHKNEFLRTRLTETIPYACEKYLLSVVKNDVESSGAEGDLLAKFDVSFQYDCFLTAIVWINYREALFETYTNDQISEVTKLVPKILMDYLDSHGQYYVLSLEKDKFCILANLPDASAAESVRKALNQLSCLFLADQDYLNIYASVGNPKMGFHNIHESYREAKKMCTLFSPFNPEKVISYHQSDGIAHSFYTIEEENKLFNYLMSGNSEESKTHLTEILSRVDDGGADDHYRRDLYLQIYNTCLRVLDCKKIDAAELMGDGYIDMIRKVDLYSPGTLADYLDQLILRITSRTKKAFARPELSEIKDYIDSHYSEDIYLDALAQKYGITVKYMSKLLKDALDKPFKKYLTDLRIEKSKGLLESGKKGIEEISVDVGFNNRVTFIRAFKLHEGITPTEYRKLAATGKKAVIKVQLK